MARAVRRGERTAEEVLEAHLAVVLADNPEINALVHVDAEGARAQARALDERVTAGAHVGALAGVPVVVKDNIDVGGQVTSAGSAGRSPVTAARDATAVTRLRAAGAVVLGRANMDELAMGASTQTSAFGPTRNPLDPRRSPGGSSGGSAAAVAAGMAPVSLGTDTGGSIREPASQCGLVGVAPSRSLVSRRGVLPFDPDLDTVGPLARTVADAWVTTEVLAGRRLRPQRRERLVVGVPDELRGPANHPGVLALLDAALDRLRALGCDVRRVRLPSAPGALETYMVLTSVAALPVLRHRVQTPHAGAEVVRRHEYADRLLREGGHLVTSAAEARDRLRGEVAAALAEVDLLVSPTMPTTAPMLFGAASPEELTDPLARPYTDCWTVVTSLAGVPSLSVPMGLSADDGMPAGLMLVGPAGRDGDLLALASRFAGET
ncbi:Asp-tRNA(Asn)/Glu-tRNA(Gln) amidotransferase subunit GatA [Nocardioides marmoraquaticus]